MNKRTTQLYDFWYHNSGIEDIGTNQWVPYSYVETVDGVCMGVSMAVSRCGDASWIHSTARTPAEANLRMVTKKV